MGYRRCAKSGGLLCSSNGDKHFNRGYAPFDSYKGGGGVLSLVLNFLNVSCTKINFLFGISFIKCRISLRVDMTCIKFLLDREILTTKKFLNRSITVLPFVNLSY